MKSIILLSLFVALAKSESETERLKHHLLKKYDKHTKPEGQVMVSIGVNPKRLDYFAKWDMLFLTNWNVMTWKDSRLAWDPKDFNGLKVIHLPEWDIWTPDVVNFYSLDKPVYFGKYEAIVDQDGSVMIVPAMKQKVFCKQQQEQNTFNCTLKMGSWHYSAADIDLVPMDSDLSEPLMTLYKVQKVESTRVEGKYPDIPDVYPYLKISILFTVNDDAKMNPMENMDNHIYEFLSLDDESNQYQWK